MKYLSVVGALCFLSVCAFGADYQTADAEMNQVYRQVLKDYAADHLFLQKLKVSQRAWVQYRDAYLESIFPKDDKIAEYGSAYRECANQILAEVTEARTKQLRQWLDGIAEGDVCSGSIRMK
jgi:uncharacterized protein YecT (DUF1311 family)